MSVRCAVFASGGGTNFQALLDKQRSGELHVEFALMVGNNSSAGAFERARAHGIPVLHIAPSHFATPEEYAGALLGSLSDHRVELIILAGYMKMLPPGLIREYRFRIVNIHPGLLPAFGGRGMYGQRVHEAVIAYGAKITGVTVHFVDEEYDHGVIILQEPLRVLDTDNPRTLGERVLEVEHAHFWRAIEAIAQGRLRVDGRRVLGDV